MGDDMNKKGFTLVELLGVFSITALILLITVPSVTSTLRKAKENQYQGFLDDIFLAAEAYIGVNHADFYELKTVGGKAYISLQKLMAADYLKSTVKDPKTGKKLYNEAYYTVIVTTNSKKTFDYELVTKQVYHPYEVGDTITYDPGDGIVRTWNVLKKSTEQDSSVIAILNENLGEDITWCESGTSNTCDNYLNTTLLARTSKWLYVKDNITLLSIDEVSEYCSVQNFSSTGTTYDITGKCSFLQSNLDNKSYWTTSKTGTTAAWLVSENNLKTQTVNKKSGIRPVITILKYK